MLVLSAAAATTRPPHPRVARRLAVPNESSAGPARIVLAGRTRGPSGRRQAAGRRGLAVPGFAPPVEGADLLRLIADDVARDAPQAPDLALGQVRASHADRALVVRDHHVDERAVERLRAV